MTKPQKYFGIGLSRTGTKSLAVAMSMLGFRSKHNPEIEDIDEFHFTSDIVIAARYKFLDYYYPQAKWILTIRDMDSWIESCRKHFRRGQRREDGVNINLRRALHRFLIFGICHFDEEIFRRRYLDFISEVYLHFFERKDDLLTINIKKGEGWEKLCPFVGRPIPTTPFPYRHKRKEIAPK